MMIKSGMMDIVSTRKARYLVIFTGGRTNRRLQQIYPMLHSNLTFGLQMH